MRSVAALSNAYGLDPIRADEVFFVSTRRGHGDPSEDLDATLLAAWRSQQLRAQGRAPRVGAHAPFEGPGLAAFFRGLRFGFVPLVEGLESYALEARRRVGEDVAFQLLLPAVALTSLDRELRLEGVGAPSPAPRLIPGARLDEDRQVFWQRPDDKAGRFLHFASVYPVSASSGSWSEDARVERRGGGVLAARKRDAATWAAELRGGGVVVSPVLPKSGAASETLDLCRRVRDASSGRLFALGADGPEDAEPLETATRV